MAVLASIPSPPISELHLGPLTIHIYGILVGLGVAVAYSVTVKRYARLGGDPGTAERAAMWAVVFGFLGARAAYVSTHLGQFVGRWWHVIAIWEGGIALFGGLTVGGIAAVVVLRRRGGDFWSFAEAIAVGLPAAQAIGRWGNYFNQELFGTPSDLPWAVEIDPVHRPAAYPDAATFHPAFLYESLWNLALIGLLLSIERRGWLRRRGSLFAVYMIGYGVGRFLLELIRTDTTFRFLGLSRNGWVSAGVILGGILWLWLREVRDRRSVGSLVS